MKRITTLILVILMSGMTLPSQTPRSDTRQDPPPGWIGDGCSLWPDGDYRECCEAHDRDYFRGGTKSERKASDKRLRQCVRAKGHKYISKFMYYGVRIGGVSWLPTPFRWGFGQKKPPKQPKTTQVASPTPTPAI